MTKDKTPQADFIRAGCCKHGTVFFLLLKGKEEEIAFASMSFDRFMKLAETVIADHDKGGYNCDEEMEH